MVIYVINGRVIWINEDVSIKEQAEFINDNNCIVIDKVVEYPEIPNDGYNYSYIWNDEKQEIELLKGAKIEAPHEEITKQTYTTVEVSSSDNLTNMDMLIGIDERLNMIMEHLGLIS